MPESVQSLLKQRKLRPSSCLWGAVVYSKRHTGGKFKSTVNSSGYFDVVSRDAVRTKGGHQGRLPGGSVT